MLLTALTKSPYFKDNPASLALCPPNQELQRVFSLCTQSAVSTEGSAASAHNQARASASWLPRGVSACETLCERPWGQPQASAGEPRCFTTYPDPRRAYSWSSASQLLTVQDTGSIPLEQPKVYGPGSCVITSQTCLSSAHWLLHLILVFIQLASVLDWTVISVHVTVLLQPNPSVYPRHQWAFPPSLLQAVGAARYRGGGI